LGSSPGRSTFNIFFFVLKEIDSETNDFKKKSRGLGLKSKRKDKKCDSSLFEGDHIFSALLTNLSLILISLMD
jgi:hypothetical protein